MAKLNGIAGHSKLEGMIKKCIPEPILQLSLSKGSNEGDNVLGKMLSVQVSTASGKTHDLVIKSLVSLDAEEISTEEIFSARVMAIMKVFETELAYYDRIQPEMEKLLQHSLPTPKYFHGQCDAENYGQDSFLVLEDLRPQGFRMADKMAGLTLEEVRMALEKIAKFHAASYVYICKKSQTLQNGHQNQEEFGNISADPLLGLHVFARSDGLEANVSKNYINSIYFEMLDVLKQKEQLTPALLDKIISYCQDPHGLILKCSKDSMEKYFPVINHGDLWVNNMLFRYDQNGTPEDLKFVDFQQCRYSSVFDELHYFVYTCTTAKFRKEYLEDCLNFYYDAFNEMFTNNLDFTKPEGFTRESFFEGYHEFLGGAFGYAVIAVPFQVGVPREDSEGGSDGENESADDAKEKKVESNSNPELTEEIINIFNVSPCSLKSTALNSPIAIKRLQEMCLEMDDLNLFDI